MPEIKLSPGANRVIDLVSRRARPLKYQIKLTPYEDLTFRQVNGKNYNDAAYQSGTGRAAYRVAYDAWVSINKERRKKYAEIVAGNTKSLGRIAAQKNDINASLPCQAFDSWCHAKKIFSGGKLMASALAVGLLVGAYVVWRKS